MKEHVSKFVELYIKEKPKQMSIAAMNTFQRSDIAEHLVKNPGGTKRYEDSKFRILGKC